MSFEVDAGARREALRIKREPNDPRLLRTSGMLGNLAVNEQPGSRLVVARARSMKPATFGLTGVFVEQSTRRLLDSRSARGDFGLLRVDGKRMRHVRRQDLRSWKELEACWEDTYSHDVTAVFDGPSSTTLEALESLWELRKRAIGTELTLVEHMRGGAGTASREFVIGAFGMNKFMLGQQGYSDRSRRLQTLRRSPTPFLNAVELDAGQLHAFNAQYGGEWHDEERDAGRLTLGNIDSGVYQFAPSGSIIYTDAMEYFPLAEYGALVGDMPSDPVGPRIGCPILLTPQLLQQLWSSFVDTLERTDLV